MYRLLIILLLLSVTVPGAYAQETINNASLTGRVNDATGAVVHGASITARQTATNLTFNAVSDTAGRFRFPYLQVGQYEVTIHEAGFGDARRAVTLTIGAAFDLPVTLSAGTSATVDVISTPPLIETNRSQIGETVLQPEVADLPFQGRNYLDLALLVPGVSPTNTAATQTLAETSEVVGQGYSVNSQRNFSNSFVVDGLSDNDDAAGVAGNVFSMDVVREFQVVTAGGQAEFGRAMGGYFNIVTRSGTNNLHGTAYGFLRNQRMNAANPLLHQTLPLTQGIYGASLSGPLQKDRTFFFVNYEEQRLNTNGILTVSGPTATSVNAKLISSGYGGPLLPVGAPQYPTTLHTDTAFVRGDRRFSPNDLFNARYSFYKLSSINARGVGGLSEASNGTSVYDTDHTVAASNVLTLSPRTFNETRGQFSYDDLYAPPNDQTGPAVTISSVATFGRSTSSPTGRLNYLTELVDNFVMQRGAHTIKSGVDFLYNSDTITYPQSLRGSYSFSSLANFQVGTYNTGGYTQNFGAYTVQQGNPNLGFYVQDEWKFSPALTIDAGVRYDLEWLKTITADKNNVSPRIGLAWSPFANRKTVLRASYGLYYDRVPLRPLANALLSANNTIDPAQARFLSYTFSPTDAGAPVFPAVATAPPAGAKPNYSTMDPNIQNPYSQQASLGIEQQISHHGTFGVSYQHLRGEHLIAAINTNINPDGTRPDTTRGNVKPYSSKFDSVYDGLELSILERPTSWGEMRLSYTWSHAIDDVGEFFFSAPINNLDPSEDRSRADDDQRHRVVFNAILNSPLTPARSLAEHMTHGWKLSGVLQYYSALPFNVTTGGNTKQSTTQRPCTNGYTLTGTNPCTEGLRGAVIGRNAGTGFDLFNLSSRLSRSFSLTEKVKLEALAEVFNALNHRNDMLPSASFGTGTYPATPNVGTTTPFRADGGVGDPRTIQLGARVSF